MKWVRNWGVTCGSCGGRVSCDVGSGGYTWCSMAAGCWFATKETEATGRALSRSDDQDGHLVPYRREPVEAWCLS